MRKQRSRVCPARPESKALQAQSVVERSSQTIPKFCTAKSSLQYYSLTRSCTIAGKLHGLTAARGMVLDLSAVLRGVGTIRKESLLTFRAVV